MTSPLRQRILFAALLSAIFAGIYLLVVRLQLEDAAISAPPRAIEAQRSIPTVDSSEAAARRVPSPTEMPAEIRAKTSEWSPTSHVPSKDQTQQGPLAPPSKVLSLEEIMKR